MSRWNYRLTFTALILAMAVSHGCTRAPAPAKRQAAAPLTEQQRELNVVSFDKVWNTVREKHWDPKLNGVDWDAVRAELRPKVGQATTMREARAVMSDMIGRLEQSHFGIIPRDVYAQVSSAAADDSEDADEASDNAGSAGIDLAIIDGEAVVSKVWPESPAAQAGVRPGWIIERIGKRQIAKGLTRVREAYADSSLREFYLVAAATGPLEGDIGDEISVTFRDGRDRAVIRQLTLAKHPGTPAKFGNIPTFYVTFEAKKLDLANVGYIAFSAFFDPPRVMSKFAEAMGEFASADGIIIDLRGNPGGIGAMAMGIGGFFIDTPGQKLGTMRTRSAELNFVLNPRAETYAGPLAILVDGRSMSTSEVLAGGLQDLKRARIFGTRTPGAALPSVVERLPNGDGFQYAIADYISTGGERLEGRGVIPDEVVEPDRAALLAGKDPVLDAAVRWIQSQHHTTIGTTSSNDLARRNHE